MSLFNSREYHASDCHVIPINIVLTFSFLSYFIIQEIRLKRGKAYENFPTYACYNSSSAWLPGKFPLTVAVDIKST